MANRANIPIKAAEDISKTYDCPVVIVFSIEGNGNTFGVTTYGRTKALCRHAADLGKKFSEAVLNGTVEPAQVEPMDIPDEPTQWEGRSR